MTDRRVSVSALRKRAERGVAEAPLLPAGGDITIDPSVLAALVEAVEAARIFAGSMGEPRLKDVARLQAALPRFDFGGET